MGNSALLIVEGEMTATKIAVRQLYELHKLMGVELERLEAITNAYECKYPPQPIQNDNKGGYKDEH